MTHSVTKISGYGAEFRIQVCLMSACIFIRCYSPDMQMEVRPRVCPDFG